MHVHLTLFLLLLCPSFSSWIFLQLSCRSMFYTCNLSPVYWCSISQKALGGGSDQVMLCIGEEEEAESDLLIGNMRSSVMKADRS